MFMLFSLKSEDGAFFWSKMVYLGVCFIPITYLHFIIFYLKKKNTLLFLIFGYIVSILFAVSVLISDKFLSGYYVFPWGYYPKAGLLHRCFLALVITIIIYVALLILKSMRQNKNDFVLYNQNKYLLIGVLFYSSASIDFLTNYGIPFYPMGFIPILISMVIMSYAIMRHNLMDINVVIRKGLIYSTLISLITISYVIVALLVENLCRGYIGYTSLPLTILIISSFVILFQPVKNKIQKIVDKNFFHGSIYQIDNENIRLREELQKQEKLRAVATLAAGMAHEIKNPLTSIKTFTEYIDKKKDDPAFIKNFKSIVGSEVDRINHIVKQLLEFSKPSELDLQKTDIGKLLDETLNLLSNDLLRNNIRVERSYAPLPLAEIDPQQIKQVFLNLFLNAIDAMETSRERRLKVSTKATNAMNAKNAMNPLDL